MTEPLHHERPDKRSPTKTRGAPKPVIVEPPALRRGFRAIGRGLQATAETTYEKPVLVPDEGNSAPADHAWATARFALDIMAEHALFFTLLMPAELAPEQRKEALAFQVKFRWLAVALDGQGPPAESGLRAFTRSLEADIQPFVDYKRENHAAQMSGELQSLVWPLFFDHTAREAERWILRLQEIAAGDVEPARAEVIDFWGGVMDEHFRFIAHLLDPNEYALVQKAYATSAAFQAMAGDAGGSAGLLGRDAVFPASATPADFLTLAEDALAFKTDAVRKIEAGKIQSIINPILADHVRREAVWFVDELKRVDER